jgi:hypothetical protein
VRPLLLPALVAHSNPLWARGAREGQPSSRPRHESAPSVPRPVSKSDRISLRPSGRRMAPWTPTVATPGVARGGTWRAPSFQASALSPVLLIWTLGHVAASGAVVRRSYAACATPARLCGPLELDRPACLMARPARAPPNPHGVSADEADALVAPHKRRAAMSALLRPGVAVRRGPARPAPEVVQVAASIDPPLFRRRVHARRRSFGNCKAGRVARPFRTRALGPRVDRSVDRPVLNLLGGIPHGE